MEATLPRWFCEFLESHGVSLATLFPTQPLPRYVRIKPCDDAEELQRRTQSVHSEFALDAASPPVSVPWLPGFLKLDGNVRIASSQAYKSGWIYGIDASSGFAIHALDLQPDDQVLDICCAPGTKLCYIADLIGKTGTGTVTGVDISESRLAIARSVARKYGMDRIRLFCADGTTFQVHAPTRLGPKTIDQSLQQITPQSTIPDANRIRPFHATRLLREDPQIKGPLYSKVIVDAECTTDGSVAHLETRSSWKGWDSLQTGWISSPQKLNDLETLQRALLVNGFKMLKPGGILVYSTCSLTRRQNEDVIAWFLDQPDGKRTRLEPIPGAEHCPLAPSHVSLYRDVAGIEHVVRFDPISSRTSGLFIARLRKINE